MKELLIIVATSKTYIRVALKYGNEVFGDNCIFQQDGANPHRHHSTQEWCSPIAFHHLLTGIVGLPNSPDLNPLDCSIWDELIRRHRLEQS